jgi:hypothetical protein
MKYSILGLRGVVSLPSVTPYSVDSETLRELGVPSAQLRNAQSTGMDERAAALLFSVTNLLRTLATGEENLDMAVKLNVQWPMTDEARNGEWPDTEAIIEEWAMGAEAYFMLLGPAHCYVPRVVAGSAASYGW